MLGVLPRLRDRGIGLRLKLQQRRLVLRQGLDLVRWTFDPLQSRNAFFNLEKLAVIARDYLVDVYPSSASRFNAGLETDRFHTEWWIRSRRARDRAAGRVAPRTLADAEPYAPALETRRDADGWLHPVRARLRLRERRVGAEIPDDLDALKAADLALARRWRRQTRAVFQAYFARGYVLHGYATGPEGRRRRGIYLLERGFRFA